MAYTLYFIIFFFFVCVSHTVLEWWTTVMTDQYSLKKKKNTQTHFWDILKQQLLLEQKIVLDILRKWFNRIPKIILSRLRQLHWPWRQIKALRGSFLLHQLLFQAAAVNEAAFLSHFWIMIYWKKKIECQRRWSIITQLIVPVLCHREIIIFWVSPLCKVPTDNLSFF